MMARAAAACLLLMFGVSAAFAQPNVAGGDRAGRERERFIEGPLDRFFRPGPFHTPPVVDDAKRPRKKSKKSKRPRPNR